LNILLTNSWIIYNNRGKQLLEFCVTTKLRILNGRVIGDLFGKYTCHKPTGSSVVDYIILSEELLTHFV
jgi:hypothetical protein